MFERIKPVVKPYGVWVLGLLVFGIVFFQPFRELIDRCIYEFSGPSNWDASIYWAVGRGMVNGRRLYSEIFDIKPPGIFLLSALSLRLTDNNLLCHIGQGLVIILTAFAPILATFFQKKRFSSRKEFGAALGLSALFGVVIAIYSADRSGEFQVESFGAAMGFLYVVGISMDEERKLLRTIFMVLGVLGACGFKEPFVLSILAVCLIFSRNPKGWIRNLVIPFSAAALIGCLGLLALGIWGPFFHDYIGFMMKTHVSRMGSPWVRGMDVLALWRDTQGYIPGFGALLAVLFGFVAWSQWSLDKERGTRGAFFGGLVRVLLGLYLVSLSVGLGGEYFGHHYIFALPAYFGWFMWLITWEAGGQRTSYYWLPAVVFLMTVVGLLSPKTNYQERMDYWAKAERRARQDAQYVDAVLDAEKLTGYAFVGRNGPEALYGWTKHSPMGPLFFQLSGWMDNGKFRRNTLDNLKNAQFVVQAHLRELGSVENEVMTYLRDNFTDVPWPSVAQIPRPDGAVVTYLFRKR